MTKTQAPIDLSSLSTRTACDKGYELELLHPHTRAPLGQFITILGKDSEVFRTHVRAKANERLRKNQETQRRGRIAEPITVEQNEQDTIDLLVICTTGFRNVTFGGGPLEFNPANAARLYGEPWISEQVDAAIGDLGNFMTG